MPKGVNGVTEKANAQADECDCSDEDVQSSQMINTSRRNILEHSLIKTNIKPKHSQYNLKKILTMPRPQMNSHCVLPTEEAVAN